MLVVINKDSLMRDAWRYVR